jgi:hypothetical protein
VIVNLSAQVYPKGGDFCAFFGGCDGYPVDNVGCGCLDKIDGFAVVARRLYGGRVAPLGKFDRNSDREDMIQRLLI